MALSWMKRGKYKIIIQSRLHTIFEWRTLSHWVWLSSTLTTIWWFNLSQIGKRLIYLIFNRISDEEDDEDYEQSVEILGENNHYWQPVKISSQNQIQIEFMQGWSNCGKSLWKYGIAVSYKINLEVFSKNALYTKQENILLCLDDFNDIIKEKLSILDNKGVFELVEWIDQYERKGWYPIASSLNKSDIDNIIKHTVKINYLGNFLKCTVCKGPVKNQAWVWMENSCCWNQSLEDKNNDDEVLNTVIIWNNHIGVNKQQALNFSSEENHRIMCFNYEKSRKGWIPKNIYRHFPHNVERKIIVRKELIAKINSDQMNMELNEAHKFKYKMTSSQAYDENDTQELFKRVFYIK